MNTEPLIRAFWTTAQKDGSCVACGERLLRVKKIEIGTQHQTQSFRLCDACTARLIAELKRR
jgi:hypothetical protein